MPHIKSTLAIISIIAFASPALADSHVKPIQEVLPELTSAIVQDDLIDALRQAYNERRQMTQSDIDQLEATWQREIDENDHPLVDSVVLNRVADRMRQLIDQRGDMITEIGVIDARGLSIAQSSPNSDIWQGDEPKWQKTFLVGADAVFIDEVEFDSSTQSMQAQANFAVADPDTGRPIGAVTVGFNVDSL